MKLSLLLLLSVFLLWTGHSLNQPSNFARLLQNSTQSRTCPIAIMKMPYEKPEHLQWRSDILNGITTIPQLGTPYRLVVFGENAASISVGKEAYDIIFAAAQLGAGRVVVISNSLYLDQVLGANSNPPIAQLQQNIKRWVTNNKWASNNQLLFLDSYFNLNKISTTTFALYIQKNYNYSETDSQAIYNFVLNGGGLIVALNGTGVDIESDNFLLRILNDAGIAFTSQSVTPASVFSNNAFNYDQSHLLIQMTSSIVRKRDYRNYLITFWIMGQVRFLNKALRMKFISIFSALVSRVWIGMNYPSSQNPVVSYFIKSRLKFYHDFILYAGTPGVTAQGYQTYIGKVEGTPQIIAATDSTTLDTNFKNQYFFSGYYALAGQTVQLQVTSPIFSLLEGRWTIFIGILQNETQHTATWFRWPKVSVSARIDKSYISLISPFGGPIFFKSAQQPYSALVYVLKNVIKCSYFDDPPLSIQNDRYDLRIINYQNMLSSLSPIACIYGPYFGICLPRKSMQNVFHYNVTTILNYFYGILTFFNAMIGMVPESQKKLWVIPDYTQNGTYYSGNPLRANIKIADPTSDQFIFNLTLINSQGHPKLLAAIARNFLQPGWAFGEVRPVMEKFFVVLGHLQMLNKDWKSQPAIQKLKSPLESYLANPSYEVLKNNPDIYLILYCQFIDEFTYNAYQNVFTYYQTQGELGVGKNSSELINLFWTVFADQVQKNILPRLDRYKIPLTEATRQIISAFPSYELKNYTLTG